MPTAEDILKYVAEIAPAVLDKIIGHWPDADFSAIKRPAGESAEDARTRALEGT